MICSDCQNVSVANHCAVIQKQKSESTHSKLMSLQMQPFPQTVRGRGGGGPTWQGGQSKQGGEPSILC